jgi:hypothetical protein
VADAAAVAARADGVILVVRYGTTTEEHVTSALETLRSVSAPLLGTVLNMTPAPRRRRDRIKTYAPQRPAQPPPTLDGSALPPGRSDGPGPDTAVDTARDRPGERPSGFADSRPNGARPRDGADEPDSANR